MHRTRAAEHVRWRGVAWQRAARRPRVLRPGTSRCLPHQPGILPPPLHPCPATPPQQCSDPADAAGQEEAARWAEHPAIVASVLEPGAAGGPRLRDIPLEATFGR